MVIRIKSPKKVLMGLRVLFAVVLAIILIFVIKVVADTIADKDYVSVDAKITSVFVRDENGIRRKNSTNKTSFVRYGTIEYTYNSQEYTSEIKLESFHNAGEGDTITIRVNPDNAHEIAEDFENKGIITGIFGMIVFDILIFLLIKWLKKKYYSESNE